MYGRFDFLNDGSKKHKDRCSKANKIGIKTNAERNAKKLKGADVEYRPMYPNFPQQVMEASDFELHMNAIIHYFTHGAWTPEYEKLSRKYAIEPTKLITIDTISKDEFFGIFTDILASNESISQDDKDIVTWFLDNYGSDLVMPSDIPHKENVAIVGAYMVENGMDVSGLVKTSTDVLRIATAMSGGDMSLADNTRFTNFKRSQRRNLIKALGGVINIEDINRHSGKWTRLAHNLHVGDYSKKVYDVLSIVRNNEKVVTFNANVEKLLLDGNYVKAATLLTERPGEFARRIDYILRSVNNKRSTTVVLNKFLDVIDRVSTKVLLQLLGYYGVRNELLDGRVVFPKGSVQYAHVIDGLDPLPQDVVDTLIGNINSCLVERFSNLESMGKVYISPDMKGCPIPAQQRSASTGALETYARGTRVPLGDETTLRFFIYWKGDDIDLSAAMYDKNFVRVDHISYTNLRTDGACHSGDITWAPNGASEFIDIDIKYMLNRGVRYVAMNVYVYSGPSFADHSKCYVGWMGRTRPKSREIYEPSTVKQKFDLVGNTRTSVPVIFDLKTREAVWADLSALPRDQSRDGYYRGNNIENNANAVKTIMEAIITNRNKVSLYDLFNMHAMARGSVVDTPEDADVVIDWDGDIKPTDINKIHSSFMG